MSTTTKYAVMQIGDVIYTQSESFISKGIRHFSTHRGERPSWASHAALSMIPGEISEAVAEGIKINPISSIRGPAVALRVPGLTDQMRTAIANSAISDLGRPYPYAKVFGLHLIDSVLFGGRYVARRFAFSANNYCNAHVAKALRASDHPYAIVPFDLDEATPDDMLDWQVRQGHRVVWHQQGALETLRQIYPEVQIAS